MENLFIINLEVLLPVLHSWRSLETIGRKLNSVLIITDKHMHCHYYNGLLYMVPNAECGL